MRAYITRTSVAASQNVHLVFVQHGATCAYQCADRVPLSCVEEEEEEEGECAKLCMSGKPAGNGAQLCVGGSEVQQELGGIKDHSCYCFSADCFVSRPCKRVSV